MHEKPLRTIVVVQWQGNKKTKRDGSKARRKETKDGKISNKGIGIWLILMAIMQFCLGILGIANIKECDKRGRFMLKTRVFEKATHYLGSENANIHQFWKRNFLKTQNQTFAFLSFCPKMRIFVQKMWGQTGPTYCTLEVKVGANKLTSKLIEYEETWEEKPKAIGVWEKKFKWDGESKGENCEEISCFE